MNPGNALSVNLFGGTPPVDRTELVFPVLVTDVISSSGITSYTWREQTIQPNGLLTDAVPQRSGLANDIAPAFEMNQDGTGLKVTVLDPPFYAWCRQRAVYNGSIGYDLLAPLGTSATFYGTVENFVSSEQRYGPQNQTYYAGANSVINYGDVSQPAPAINYVQDVTETIYPGRTWVLQSIDNSGNVVDTILQATVNAFGVVTLFTDADWSPIIVGGGGDGKVYITAADTTKDYLNSKLVSGTGITFTVGNAGFDEFLTVATTGPVWVKVTKTHTDLNAAATNQTFDLYSLPAKGVLHAATIKNSVAFTGGGISNYTVRVEDAGTTPLTSGLNVNLSPSDTTGFDTSPPVASAILPRPYDFGATYMLKLRVQTTGADMDQATAGSLDVWLLLSTLP